MLLCIHILCYEKSTVVIMLYAHFTHFKTWLTAGFFQPCLYAILQLLSPAWFLNATFYFSFPPSCFPFFLLLSLVLSLCLSLWYLNTIVWRCNSLPLCVVRIITMERHPLLPLLPPHSPRPSFPAWSSMAPSAVPDPVSIPMTLTTRPTATARQRRRAPCHQAGASAAWLQTATS